MTTLKSSEATLKPCPFCGCTAIYVTHTNYYDTEDTVSIFCNGCKAHVTLEQNEAEGINEKTKSEAIEAWNTRVVRTCHITTDMNARGIDFPKCSLCGYGIPFYGDYANGKDYPANYCPNCGAKVVE